MKKRTSQIVKRYAVTLFEIVKEKKQIEVIAEQISNLQQIIDPNTLNFLTNYQHTDEDKKEIISLVLSSAAVSEDVNKFINLVFKNRRIALIKEIFTEFLHLTDEELGFCRVNVIFANQINQDIINEVSQQLQEKYSKKIIVSSSIDNSLEAGYLVKIGNLHIDASLKLRLARIKESLSQGVE